MSHLPVPQGFEPFSAPALHSLGVQAETEFRLKKALASVVGYKQAGGPLRGGRPCFCRFRAPGTWAIAAQRNERSIRLGGRVVSRHTTITSGRCFRLIFLGRYCSSHREDSRPDDLALVIGLTSSGSSHIGRAATVGEEGRVSRGFQRRLFGSAGRGANPAASSTGRAQRARATRTNRTLAVPGAPQKRHRALPATATRSRDRNMRCTLPRSTATPARLRCINCNASLKRPLTNRGNLTMPRTAVKRKINKNAHPNRDSSTRRRAPSLRPVRRALQDSYCKRSKGDSTILPRCRNPIRKVRR